MKATDERIMKPDAFPGKSTYAASFLQNFPSLFDGNVPVSKSLVNTQLRVFRKKWEDFFSFGTLLSL